MIAVSMGDPNGVGPEIALKTVPKLNRETALVLVGDRNALSLAADRLKLKVPVIEIESLEEHRMDSSVYLLHTEGPLPLEVSPGKLDAAAGAASAAYVEAATVMARKDQVSAIVTLPVNKEAVRFSLPDFTGHTGFIADLCGVSSSVMLLVSDRLAVSHVSTHCSLADAVARTKKERILSVIEMTAAAVGRIRNNNPLVAVCGLNPHAGEHGAFGSEEELEIIPAIEAARAKGLNVTGPEAGDTIFFRALQKGSTISAVVAMYHDQGHIPMKTLDFDGGVNISLGLPIVRTSVDHGTAFDIAYKGIARTRSFELAVKLAELLSEK
jgi:4-phospho-D-threonate 3-dehydrogenase / 4-phospho-D-erythronate 3-dehydrogenase